MRFWGPGAKQQKSWIPRLMMSLCDKTYFSTLVTGKFRNFRIPTSIVSLLCIAWEKYHVLVYVVIASSDRGTDHFCCFALDLEITFPFAVCKENSMLTELGISRFPPHMITALASFARQLHTCWESASYPTWLTMYSGWPLNRKWPRIFKIF